MLYQWSTRRYLYRVYYGFEAILLQKEQISAVGSRISSKPILKFVICVGYFDRVYYGFYVTPLVWQKMTAVRSRISSKLIFCQLPTGIMWPHQHCYPTEAWYITVGWVRDLVRCLVLKLCQKIVSLWKLLMKVYHCSNCIDDSTALIINMTYQLFFKVRFYVWWLLVE